MDDLFYMQRALLQARCARRAGEVPIGAVLVAAGREGPIIGRGHNLTISRRDPTAHAEVVAIRRGARKIGNHRLAGTTLYVTLEPCLLCLGAITEARVRRVVYAAADPKRGALTVARGRAVAALLHHHFTVTGGLMAEEAARLLRSFFAPKRLARNIRR